jgi:homoserine O-succinyltransferase
MMVHVVEPGRPGGGLYAQSQPDYFILNTPCGQHSMYPFPDVVDEGSLGRGFYEWAAERGYRWQGDKCVTSGEGRPVGPHDFLPRRLMGEYLQWFYSALRAEAPPNVTITHYPTLVVNIEPTPDGRERVQVQVGSDIVVDHVILTTGHMRSAPNADPVAALAMSPYPIERYVGATLPDEKVAVEGMGLVALDVIAALTTGLGGRFTSEPGDKLRYHPSGREPALYVFSRRGYPYCAKSLGASDPMGGYKPAICTVEAVTQLKSSGPEDSKRQIDARRELLPLVFAEMELHYYSSAAGLADGYEVALAVRDKLVQAWEMGTFSEERSKLARSYGNFIASQHLFVGEDSHYVDGPDYESRVYEVVAADVREALVAGGASPVKAALETLRALRDTLRLAIEFKGLTLSSHLDFVANLQSRFARLVAGPPVHRCQQLLALIDAGVLKLPFGPSPELEAEPDGRIRVRSTALDQPCEVVVDRLIRAHVDQPSIARTTSTLLANLGRRGRVRPLTFGTTPVGGIDLSEDFHPLNSSGEAEQRLWVFGVLTEGARYFTLYIPSPKSRVRAFVDAGICADQVVRTTTVSSMPEGTTVSAVAAGPMPSGSGDGSARLTEPPGTRPLRIALVNNMPDGAFEETEQQFGNLLGTGAPDIEVVITRYTLPGVARQPRVQALIEAEYQELSHLYANPPDAVVVTGAKPKRADLAEEPYWPALEQLLWWVRGAVPSMIASCMSAHGALWAFDRLPRRMLLEKCSGVFEQDIAAEHSLMAGVGSMALPHSRFNEIPVADVLSSGYEVLAQSTATGWTAAVGQRGECQVLLLQGHPEYGRHTLLREYRRDVRHYLSGDQGSYPHIPTGYLDGPGVAALAQFERDIANASIGPELMEAFPFDLAARHVKFDWDGPAGVLIGNWLRSTRELCAKRSYSSSSS